MNSVCYGDCPVRAEVSLSVPRRNRRFTELPGSGLSTPRPCTGSFQLFLDQFPNRLTNYWLMLPIPDLRLMTDLSDVDRIPQQCIDLAARERIAALDPPDLKRCSLERSPNSLARRRTAFRQQRSS